jgi:hypothetical protein
MSRPIGEDMDMLTLSDRKREMTVEDFGDSILVEVDDEDGKSVKFWLEHDSAYELHGWLRRWLEGG